MYMTREVHPGAIRCRPHRQEVAHLHRRPPQEATRQSIPSTRPHIAMPMLISCVTATEVTYRMGQDQVPTILILT